MKEEIKRINQLVAEGKLSPDDAADLIETMVTSSVSANTADPEGVASGSVPPPPPPGTPGRDPLRSLFDAFEKVLKEGKDSVDWDVVAKQAKETAKQGVDRIRTGIDEISRGKLTWGWFTSQESRSVALPLGITAGRTLKIDNALGGVRIVGGDGPASVKANAKFKGATYEDAKAKADAYVLVIEESESQTIIRQPDTVGLAVELEIAVPKGVTVEVRGEHGSFEIYETQAGARVYTRSGDIRMRSLNGPIEIHADNATILVEDSQTPSLALECKAGHIGIDGVKGNLNVRTATGDITISQAAGKVISAESVSGRVNVDVEHPISGSLNIRTVNGSAEVTVADGSDCRVSLSTLRGSVECELELDELATTEQRVTGRLGDGSGTLDVSAVTGSIRLSLRDSTAD